MLAFDASRPLHGGARFCLAGVDEVIIGRGETRRAEKRREVGKAILAITVDCHAVSQRHARLRRTSQGWMAEDLQSKNGVHINGQQATRSVAIGKNDLITLGHGFFLIENYETDDTSDLDAADLSGSLPGMLTLLPSLSADLRNLTALATTRIPVTLVGETGTGKELVASAIHALSGRRGPYKAINCASVARTLIESEFFGYVRGAFSGADRNHPGHIEAANGGTLLLDEILTTPPELQAALLRFLQQSEVLPVGGRTPIPVDVRVIAAAQISLERAVADQHFRPDLKARLEGFVLNLLPLRERIPDTGIFVAHEFRAQGPGDGGGDAPRFTLPAALRLLQHEWPGNVRELASAVRRARTLAAGKPIDVEHLLLTAPADVEDRSIDPDQLKRHLSMTGGDVDATAARMGRSRSFIYKLIKRYGVNLREFRSA